MRDLPGYYLYRIVSGLFGLLPEPVIRRVGETVGRLLWYVGGKRRRMAERHMGRVIGPGEPARRAAQRLFGSYGRYWAEVFWVRPRRKDEIVAHTEVVNVEAVHAARDAGRGLIFALPHLGNWEAAGARAEQLRVPVLAVAEALPNRRVVDWFVSCRNALGIDVVVHARGSRVTPQLVRRLEEGGTVALVSDRDINGRGIAVRFFGEMTTMPAGPVALAVKTGAAILPVGCYFKEGRGHRFVVRDPLPIPVDGERGERIEIGTQALATVMEDIIREAPHQWHLLQPNWPSDREGQ